jgi:hypothetical protein
MVVRKSKVKEYVGADFRVSADFYETGQSRTIEKH